MNLYCVPYAGGNMWAYRPLEALLPPEIAVAGLELPGRGRRSDEPLAASLEEVADDVFDQLCAGSSPGPYALLGHSMGALLVLLAARRLQAAGLPMPEALFLSASEGPSALTPRRRHSLPHAEFIEMLREMGGCPPEVLRDPALVEFFEPILRADFRAVETWPASSGPKVDVPLTVMIGRDDDVSQDAAQAWARETTRDCRVLTFDGDHFFIHQHWAAIGDVICDRVVKGELLR